VRLGTTLPQFGNALDEADRIGEMAEDAGVDSLWVGDRLLAAVDPQSATAAPTPSRRSSVAPSTRSPCSPWRRPGRSS
jgi:alkanesulfonate monooxygenase SsuD/methylene tetrahydromethanopterin reductase-like flavin-dependent oxidoreductase (luciferase family)